MRIKNRIAFAALAVMLMAPAMASGQSSSINTFSPYTFYGLGDFSIQGPSYLRSMGGTSVAYRFNTVRNEGRLNYVNPASVSAMSSKSFLFELGLEGGNYYLKSGDKTSSYNTFNIRDIAIQLPLAKGLGLAVSVTPFSSIGYRSEMDETDEDILAGLYEGGAIAATYLYVGSGDVNQAKATIGWEPFRNFSIGVDMIYYFGKINRSYSTQITTRSSTIGFYNTSISQADQISRIMWNFGAQYSVLLAPRRFMTFGAIYQPSGKLNPDVVISSSNISTNVTSLPGKNGLISDFEMPQTISAGVYYHTHRMSVGLDYEFRDWGGRNEASEITDSESGLTMNYRNTNTVRAGFDITPARYDVRSPLKRVTYRVGLRYADYYMKYNGQNISDKTITFGVGIPLSMDSFNYLDAGLEFGQRGKTGHGLVRESYFKINLGVRLFGSDNWFRKREFGR